MTLTSVERSVITSKPENACYSHMVKVCFLGTTLRGFIYHFFVTIWFHLSNRNIIA